MDKSDENIKSIIETLINGGGIETELRETVTYGDLLNANENIWSFLFFTGYLKIDRIISSGEGTGNLTQYSL